MTNLERLNLMLKDKKLNIPDFRQTVAPSLSNLKWLRDRLPKNPACSNELKRLLALNPKEMFEEYKEMVSA